MRCLIAAALLAAVVSVGWPAAAEPPSCASLGGSVEAGQMCRLHATGPNYTLNISFPADYPDGQALADYITQNRDGFVAVAQSSGGRDQPYQLEATTEQHGAGQPPHNTRSVVLKFFQDVGGAHSSIWYKAFNYNLATRAPITFDTLFRPETKPLEVIYPIVQRQLQKQSGVEPAVPSGVGLDPTHYQNFAITDDAVIFFFGQGELFAEAAGATQVSVPRDELAPLLA